VSPISVQAGDITHTSDGDFNLGSLDNVRITGGSVRLPAQATGLGSWVTLNSLPQTLRDLKVAYYNGKVYLTGGYNGNSYSKAVYYATVNSDGSLSGWTTSPDSLPQATRDHAMVFVDNYLYVLGGHQDDVPTDAIYRAELDYDGTLRSWETSSVSLPQPLWGHAAVTYGGFIYVIGGTNLADVGTAMRKVYYTKVNEDGSLGSWAQTTSLPQPRNSHAALVSNGRIYVIGGADSSFTSHNTVYYADINSDGSLGSWTLSSSSLPTAITSHSAALYNGIIAVIGGYYPYPPGTNTNSVYFCNINSDGSLGNWSITTPYPLFFSNSAAFAVNGRIYSLGGYGGPTTYYNNVYRSDLFTSSNYAHAGTWLSPFIDVGLETTIESLSWNATLNGQNLQLRYRTAASNGIWGNWSSPSSSSPISINTTARYVQYQAFLSGDSSNTPILTDVTISVSGVTYLCGTISGNVTWTLANSPYVALCNLYLSSGTLTIEPGVVIKFKSGTGMQIGQAQLYAVGTEGSPITFTSLSGETDKWMGLYFDPNSDNGVGSTMIYCTVEKAGQGSRNANIYCSSTTQPTMTHCTVREATGYGVFLSGSPISLNNSTINNNIGDGVYCSSSAATINNCTIRDNTNDGLRSSGSPPTITGILFQSNGGYPLHTTPSAFPNLSQIGFSGNVIEAIAIDGGTISTDFTLKYYPREPYGVGCEPYAILGDITVWYSGGAGPTLTVKPGVILKFVHGAGLEVGHLHGSSSHYPGHLRAMGTSDSLITFTSLSDSTNGWDGVYFHGYGVDIYSVMDYCVVEKAGETGWGHSANIYCYYCDTTEVTISHSTISNSGGEGLYLNSSPIPISNCTISNNASDGIYCYGSSPTIDSSLVTSNLRYGMYLYNSSPTVSRSRIVDNDSYGVYCTGSTQPTIGDTINLTCDLYNNGTYEVYVNGSYDVWARYNYWAATDSAQIAARIFDHSDDPSKGTVWFWPWADSSLYENQPPGPFSLISPANDSVVQALTLSLDWEDAIDPDTNFASYSLYYDTSSSFSGPTIISGIVSSEYDITQPLIGGQSYWWKVKAIDLYGFARWSNQVWKFTVSLPPTMPVAILPENGTGIGPNGWLVWLKSTDPDSGDVVTYHLQIDDDSLFSNPEIDQSNILGDEPPPGLNWGRNASLGNLSTKVSLKAKSADFSPFVDTDSKGTILAGQEVDLLAKVKGNAVAVQLYTLEGFENLYSNTLYYWRVEAVDNHGVSSGFTDGTNNFLYNPGINNHPQPFSLLSPSDGDTVNINGFTLDWEDAYDPDFGDIVRYDLYYSLDPDFPDSSTSEIDSLSESDYTFGGKVLVINSKGHKGQTAGRRDRRALVKGLQRISLQGDEPQSPIGGTFLGKTAGLSPLSADSLLADTLYYWRVKAYDNWGAETWSTQTWSFYVTSQIPPSSFSLISPQNGDTTYTATPSLIWQESFDPNPGDSVLYTLCYGPSRVFNLDSTTIVDSLNNPQYQIPPGQLESEEMVYWKVKAYDTSGLETWSDQLNWGFSVGDIIAPDAISDLDTSTVTDSSITLIWTAPGDDGNVDTADVYDLRYSQTPVETDTFAWWDTAKVVIGEPSPAPAGIKDSCIVDNLLPGTTYYFLMKTADEVPNWSGFSNMFSITTTVGVESQRGYTELPKVFALSQNYPNPFNPATEVKYALPKDCYVRLEVYNSLGQKVATLVDGEQRAGYKTARWDANSLSSGIYFYRIQAGGFVQTRKMVLIR